MRSGKESESPDHRMAVGPRMIAFGRPSFKVGKAEADD
jgi:hypothetical protein